MYKAPRGFQLPRMGSLCSACLGPGRLDATSEEAVKKWAETDEGVRYAARCAGFGVRLRASLVAALERHRFRYRDPSFQASELWRVNAPGVLQARASDEESYVSIECQFANAGGESFLGEYYVYADFDKLDVDYFKARNGYVVVDKMDLSGY